MPLPEYGKWRLKHPLFGDNPPFPILEVDLSKKTGAAGLNMQWHPLLHMVVRPGDSVFLASYKVGSHHGMLEATYLNDQSLKVEFSGGTVETTCDGELISARGVLQGVPSAPVTIESVASQGQIHCAGDIARWFDGLVMENEHELKRLCDNYAKRNPDSWVAVGIANTARDLYSVAAHQGQGLVDTLRIGEGCYEGGWGIGKDFFRGLNFIPLFKPFKSVANRVSALRGAGKTATEMETAANEANMVRPAAGAGPRPDAPLPPPMPAMPRKPVTRLPGPLAIDPAPEAGICTSIAVVNAMQQFRGKFWMPVSKFLSLCGASLSEEKLAPGMSSMFIREAKDVLRKFGVHMCQLSNFKRNVSKGDEILNLAKDSPLGSVIVFSVKFVDRAGQSGAHAMVAWKDPQGTVYIIDRMAEATGKLSKSLAEVEATNPEYFGMANSVLQEAYLLEHCYGGFVQQGAKLLFAIGFATPLAVQTIEVKKTVQPR